MLYKAVSSQAALSLMSISDHTLIDHRMGEGYMWRATMFIAVLFFAAPVAQAQAPKTYNTNSVVLADTRTRIGHVLIVEPDCELVELTVRITKPPLNGKLEVEEGDAFPYYSKDNPRAKCNDKKLYGASLIFYAPKAGFKGSDTASVEVISTRGHSYRYVWKITVK